MRLSKKEPLHLGIRRLLTEELTAALQEIARAQTDARALHESRRALKRARAVLALGRPVLGLAARMEDRRLRAACRGLSRHRELDATLAVLDAEATGLLQPDMEVLRMAVRLHHHAHTGPHDRAADVRRARIIVDGARKRIERLAMSAVPQRALRRRFRKGYRAARRAFRVAREGAVPDAFHEWRKRMKLLLYEARMLCGIGTTGLNGLCATLAAVDDQVGRARDCLQLAGVLRGVPAAYVPVRSGLGLVALLEQTAKSEHAGALATGVRLFGPRSRAFVRRYLGD